MVLHCQILTYVRAIYIIFVKDRDKWPYNYVIPRGIYGPKGVIYFNFPEKYIIKE